MRRKRIFIFFLICILVIVGFLWLARNRDRGEAPSGPVITETPPVPIITDEDQDGDGFVDAKDNCPSVYNPVQADLNKDGEGTACDNEIVFVSDRAGENLRGSKTSAVYFADLNSSASDARRFTEDKAYYNHVAVSPDHKKLLANRVVEDTNGNGKLDIHDHKTLYVIDLADKSEVKVSGSYNAGWGGVDWSPDSQYVYASMNKTGNWPDIYKIRATDGKIIDNITEGIEKTLGYPKGGKWVSDVGVSPDGSKIVFISSPLDAQGSVVKKTYVTMINSDGSGAKLLTDGGSHAPGMIGNWPAGDFDPEFSPDGRQVVFQRAEREEGNNWGLVENDVWVIKTDGTGLRRVTPAQTPGIDDSSYGIPDWSKDNLIIMSEWYQTSRRADNYYSLGVVNSDGTNYRRIDVGAGSHVRWVPSL